MTVWGKESTTQPRAKHSPTPTKYAHYHSDRQRPMLRKRRAATLSLVLLLTLHATICQTNLTRSLPMTSYLVN